MKAIAKNIGKLNQLVGEKLHSAHKHDLSDEFKQLEQQLEVRKEGTESILQACTAYVNTLEKRKDGADKQKRLIISNLGLAMVQYGSEMNEDSSYGISEKESRELLISQRPSTFENGSCTAKHWRYSK
eukprot:Partr_v1_DN26483_c1_g1_i2_m24142 putative BAR domain protein